MTSWELQLIMSKTATSYVLHFLLNKNNPSGILFDNKTEKTFSPRPRVNFPLDILRYSGILLDTQEYSEIPWNTQRYTIISSLTTSSVIANITLCKIGEEEFSFSPFVFFSTFVSFSSFDKVWWRKWNKAVLMTPRGKPRVVKKVEKHWVAG